jgi:hypothetical protein
MMTAMENTTERLVLVPMTQLDDLLELSRRLVDRTDGNDPLRSALIGAIADVRFAATVEP